MCERLVPENLDMQSGRCHRFSKLIFFLFPLFFSLVLSSPSFALSPSELIVVFNLNLRDSRDLALYYAQKRGVPLSNLTGVDVAASENMSRPDFDKKLTPPVRAMAEKLKSQGKDPAILLVYGIPLIVGNPGVARPDAAAKALVEKKVKECAVLALQIIRELDTLTGLDSPAPSASSTGTSSTWEVLRKSEKSVAHALKYLESSQNQEADGAMRAKVLDLLLKLAGAKISVNTTPPGIIKEKGPSPGQDLPGGNLTLRKKLIAGYFWGTPPEKVLETAASVRSLEGLLGELTFWEQFKNSYTLSKTSAAVDSELALVLVGNYQPGQWLPNPFHARYDRLPGIREVREKTLMVCRLDAPTPKIVRRLVDDALETERTGLQGIFYIDARGLNGNDAYSWYDHHLLNLYSLVQSHSSMKVVIDKGPGLFPPGACPNAALYCGWYSVGKYVDSFAWQKGAVGYHVASMEASTLKKPESNVWCKRMLEKGVAATLGPVAEPYLSSFPLPDHFFPLLMSGRLPLLEVYFRTVPQIAWRQILIGDPLYTPFKKNPAFRLKP